MKCNCCGSQFEFGKEFWEGNDDCPVAILEAFKRAGMEPDAKSMVFGRINFRGSEILVLGNPLNFPQRKAGVDYAHAFKFECDQECAFCPAWIRVTNFEPGQHLAEGFPVLVGGLRIHYHRFVDDIFIPWSQFNGLGADEWWKEIGVSPEFQDEYWKKIAEVYDSKYYLGPEQAKKYADVIESFLQFQEIPTTASILSIGAGTGMIEHELAQRGYNNMTLLDRSEAMLASAQEKPGLAKANFVACDAKDFQSDQKFGLIMTFNTFCWVERKDILRICRDNWEEEGLFISDHNWFEATYKSPAADIEIFGESDDPRIFIHWNHPWRPNPD